MSQFLEDLYKASSVLQSNLKDLAAQRAVTRTNEAVQQIKASELDETKKRAALQQVSQALTADLFTAGVPAEQIALQAKNIVPEQKYYQTAEQAALNAPSGSREQALGQKMVDAELGVKKEQIAMSRDARAAALRDKQDQNFRTSVQTYQKRIDTLTKKNREAYDQANTMVSLLEANNPIADSAVPTFAARATGEVGNLTEAERKPFGGSQAIQRRLAALAQKATTGKLNDADRADLLKLGALFRDSAVRGGRQKVLDVSMQGARTLGRDPSEVFSLVAPDFVGTYVPNQQQNTLPNQAPGTAPQAPAAPQIPGLKPRAAR